MIARREFITLLGGAAIAWPVAARAQQGGKLRTIGLLSAGSMATGVFAGFDDGLREEKRDHRAPLRGKPDRTAAGFGSGITLRPPVAYLC